MNTTIEYDELEDLETTEEEFGAVDTQYRSSHERSEVYVEETLEQELSRTVFAPITRKTDGDYDLMNPLGIDFKAYADTIKPIQGLKLNSSQKLDRELFLSLETKNIYDAGIACGLKEKQFANKATLVATVSRRIRRVINNYSKYGISQEHAWAMKTLTASRVPGQMRRGATQHAVRNQYDDPKAVQGMDNENILLSAEAVAEARYRRASLEELTLSARNKSWRLLNMKMDEMIADKKARKELKLADIAKVAGITFDKGQLLEGKATEHVATLTKLDGVNTLGADKAIELIMKMKEYNNLTSTESK